MTPGADPGWARRTPEGWRLEVQVQPGARRSEVVGPLGDRLKIRLAAPAVDGKANAALVRFLADRLGISRRSLRITRGERSRTKTVEVAGPADLGELG